MFDIIDTAKAVARDWPTLPAKLPKDLETAIGVFEEAGYAQGPNVALDASKITAKNAEQTITGLAEAIATEEKFDEAKRRVRRELARRVVHLAGAAVPDVIEQIRPEFERAVSEYTGAVDLLPRDISPNALVEAGPSVLEAYQRASTAAAEIARAGSWLAGLASLPAYAGRKSEIILRVLKPTTRAELATLTKANDRSGNADAYAKRLNPAYLAAVRNGIEFEMHTPIEVAQILKVIEAQPVERRPVGIATTFR